MDHAPAKTRPLRWILGLLTVGAVTLILAVILIPRAKPGNSARLQARFDAIKKSGAPLTEEDVARLYPTPPLESNATELYLKAFKITRALPDEYTNWPVVSESVETFRTSRLSAEIRNGLAEYIKENREAIDLLHQGGSMPIASYDEGLTNGFYGRQSIPYVEIRPATQLLSLAALSHADLGESEQATLRILDSIGQARALDESPELISQMLRGSLLRLTCSTLEVVLNWTALTDDQLQRISTALHNEERVNGLKPAFELERCRGINYFDLLRGATDLGGPTTLKGQMASAWRRNVTYRERAYLDYLDTMAEYVRASKLPFPARLDDALLNGQKAAARWDTNSLVAFLSHNNASMFELEANMRAKLRVTGAVIAMERYRLHHGRVVPDSIGAPVPDFLGEVPSDPFGGQQLRYRKLANGYLVYSIGGDKTDNGGKEPPPGQAQTNLSGFDIIFTVDR